jgi:PhnB protein
VPPEVQPVPEGYATVAPWIVTRDTAGGIEFLTAAFDGGELGRCTTTATIEALRTA